jgi:Putative oxidoreductase C terminal domain
MKYLVLLILSVILIFSNCVSHGSKQQTGMRGTLMSKNYKVKLITVDPGHFHAALVQKIMYDEISPDVHVYAPVGPDYLQHLERIKSFNSRPLTPTSWNEIVYSGPDFFEKMLAEKAGNVVVLAGNNRKKAEYISRSIDAGFNVLADKPMIITSEDFPLLEAAFATAKEKGILLYDIMTERYEVASILQKLISQKPEVFGTLTEGSKDEPAVSKASIHYFSKIVSGIPLLRPEWFFDVRQQGVGIVDVTTHLVDLVQVECFPEQILYPSDIIIISAREWPTLISHEEFKSVTGSDNFSDYLQKDIKDGKLNVIANGEMVYKIKNVFVKVSVEWKYQPPTGGGDSYYSDMRGTKCDLVIRQGAEERFIPTLYLIHVKDKTMADFISRLKTALGTLPFDSLQIVKVNEGTIKINIPEKYRLSHEDHFGQVAAKFLGYMKAGNLPEWEVQGMITKYFTTTSALKLAEENKK